MSGFIGEGLMALIEPVLEGIQSADVRRIGIGVAILEHLTAGQRAALFLEHIRKILTAEGTSLGECPGRHMAYPGFG